MRSLNIGASGMIAQSVNVEVISNNIANMNTTGFKRQRPEFQDLLYQNLKRVGANSSDSGTIVPSGVQVGLGVKTAAIYRIHEQGNLTATDNTYDLAIQGKGFFQVKLPSGETAVTRDGTLQLDPNGNLVTTNGYLVLPQITIDPKAVGVSINASGQVSVKVDGTVAPTIAGQLQLAKFPNEGGLQALGDNMFIETPASGTATLSVPGSPGFGTLQQGFLETSNVNVVEEVTHLISAQRAYEMNSKVISTSDSMLGTITQLR